MSGFSNSKQQHLPSRAMCAGLGTLLLFPCVGNAVTDFEPTVYSQYLYDSNVYRLSDVERLQVDQLEDSALVQGANVDMTTSYLDYIFFASANVSRLDYNFHNILDNQQSNYALNFKGEYGLLVKYELDWNQSRQLTEFNGETAHLNFNNLVRRNHISFDLSYQVSAYWQSMVSLEQHTSRFSHPSYLTSNRNETILRLSGLYARSLNWLKPFLGFHNEDFPDRGLDSTSKLDNKNQSLVIGSSIGIAFSGHSYIYSSLAIRKRKYEDNPVLDDTSPQYIFQYRWEPSSKIEISTTYIHKSRPAELQQADYIDTDEFSLEAKWAPVYSVNLGTQLTRTDNDYKETDNSQLKDDITSIDFNATYQFLKHLKTSFSIQRHIKNSTNTTYAYRANTANIMISIQF